MTPICVARSSTGRYGPPHRCRGRVSTSPKRLPTPRPTDYEWTASAIGDALALEPDAPPHVAGVEQRQRGEHAHVEQEDVLGVLPYRVVGRNLLDLDQVREVDRRRPRGITPTCGGQPRQLIETRPAGHRDHPAGKYQLQDD